MPKRYFVESEMYPRFGFDNESDRNEMALALWQEHIYFLTVRTVNWYEGGIMAGIEEDANMNIRTWEESAIPTYFNLPTCVAFWESEQGCYIGGIAYEDEIICGCCGGVQSIEEIIEFAPNNIKPIVVYNCWRNMSHDIMADTERFFTEDNEN